MRTKIISNNILRGKAYAGTYVVVLAWDFINPGSSRARDFLGFALERAEIKDGVCIEKYWMKGIKRFKGKDEFLPPGTPVPTSEHPIQTFQWCDYTAKENHEYIYRIVPVYGQPKMLDLRLDDALELNVLTEPVSGNENGTRQGIKHDLFFNRGIIGSQAYAREFKNKIPEIDNPDAPEMKWLSRGLFEAMTGFIKKADSKKYSLRAALYEFHYMPVARAFAEAASKGADVSIVYDAESSYKLKNEEAISKARLDKCVIPRTVSEGIRHNKFIVLLADKIPVAVWTGSTNISAGGIFGHSNVGHIIWDKDIASKYLDYWDLLSDNLTPAKIRPLNKTASAIPAGLPPENSITPVFSPRDGKEENTTLEWYASLMSKAKKLMCITFAFDIDQVFQDEIKKENNVLRYVIKDDRLGKKEDIGHDKDVIFAAGSRFGYNCPFNFLEERDNPMNTNDYIHNKFMLVDPLGDDPLVITGSANFSRPSQRINDENMVVIRGDTRTADIYFGEFMRIFDHHYCRYLASKSKEPTKKDPEAGYLKSNSSWAVMHFEKESYKAKRRTYFVDSSS